MVFRLVRRLPIGFASRAYIHPSSVSTISRSLGVRYMGDDTLISGAFGYGIAVPVKHIKEVREPGSSDQETEYLDNLKQVDEAWLLESFSGYHFYNIYNTFVFLSKDKIMRTPSMYMTYEEASAEDCYERFSVRVDQKNNDPHHQPYDELNTELIAVAQKLLPKTEGKLWYPPGMYSFLTFMEDDAFDELQPVNPVSKKSKRMTPVSSGAVKDSDPEPFHPDCHHLFDIKLMIFDEKEHSPDGDGDGKSDAEERPFHIIESSRALLSQRAPNFEKFIAKHGTTNTIVGGGGGSDGSGGNESSPANITEVTIRLDELRASALRDVLCYYTTRNFVGGLPTPEEGPDRFRAVQQVREELGIRERHSWCDLDVNTHEVFPKQPSSETVTLITRSGKVYAPKAILGLVNPVLYGIMYSNKDEDGNGDGSPQRIKWRYYSSAEVRYVLLALILGDKRGGKIEIPYVHVEWIEMLMEDLGESKKSLALWYGSPYREKGDMTYSFREEPYREGGYSDYVVEYG